MKFQTFQNNLKHQNKPNFEKENQGRSTGKSINHNTFELTKHSTKSQNSSIFNFQVGRTQSSTKLYQSNNMTNCLRTEDQQSSKRSSKTSLMIGNTIIQQTEPEIMNQMDLAHIRQIHQDRFYSNMSSNSSHKNNSNKQLKQQYSTSQQNQQHYPQPFKAMENISMNQQQQQQVQYFLNSMVPSFNYTGTQNSVVNQSLPNMQHIMRQSQQQNQNSGFLQYSSIAAQPLQESHCSHNEVLYDSDTPPQQKQKQQSNYQNSQQNMTENVEHINKLKLNLFKEINRQLTYNDSNKDRIRPQTSLSSKSHMGTRLSSSKDGSKRSRLSMYDRQLLWDHARKNKIQHLRETLSMNEVEDCTFKPQLVSHNQSKIEYEEDNYKTIGAEIKDEEIAELYNPLVNNSDCNSSKLMSSNSKNNLKQSASKSRVKSMARKDDVVQEQQQKYIEKHINRLAVAKLRKDFEFQMEMAQPGSGQIWQNQLTQPSVPKITGLTLSQEKQRKGTRLSCYINTENNMVIQENSLNQEECYNDKPYKFQTIQETSEPRIKSLKRAISPQNSSYKSAKKRHSNYPTTHSIDKVLSQSNQKLKFYQDKITVANTNETIVDDLEKEGIFKRSTSNLSQYKSLLSNQQISLVNFNSIQAPPSRAEAHKQSCSSSSCYTKQHAHMMDQLKSLEQQAKSNIFKLSNKQEEKVNSKIINVIHQHIQSLEV
eukprot:403333098